MHGSNVLSPHALSQVRGGTRVLRKKLRVHLKAADRSRGVVSACPVSVVQSFAHSCDELRSTVQYAGTVLIECPERLTSFARFMAAFQGRVSIPEHMSGSCNGLMKQFLSGIGLKISTSVGIAGYLEPSRTWSWRVEAENAESKSTHFALPHFRHVLWLESVAAWLRVFQESVVCA